MSRHRWPLVLLVAVAIAVPGAVRADDPPRPNIIFVFVDDLGYGEVGAYGEPDILTPRIDQLADEGIRFSDGYAMAPLCAPSRCGLMTGFHMGHCNAHRNYGPNIPLRIEDVTVAEVLQGAGYTTALLGKWGLGGLFAPDMGAGPVNLHSLPGTKGFDQSLVYLGHAEAHHYYAEFLWRDGVEEAIPENAGGAEGLYSHDLFTDEALAFITDHAADPDPFYLQLSYTIPHREYEVPEQAPYESEPWPDIERTYAAMVTRMDADLGEIVDLVDSLGIGEQTLVLFASDNGPAQGETAGQQHTYDFFGGAGPLRGSKADLYEGGVRVPFVARWTGSIDPEQVSDLLVGTYDFLPTAAELAGAGIPEGLDGISLAPTFTGDGVQEEHEFVFFSQHGSQRGPDEPAADSALRWGDWKLVVLEDGREELFDLATDLGETTDVSAEYPDVVADMLDRIAAEDTGPPQAAWPVAELVGDVVVDGTPPTAGPPSLTALYLRFDDDGALEDEEVVVAVDDSDDVDNPAQGVNGPLYSAATFGSEVPGTGVSNDLCVHLAADDHAYLEVPHHPILGFGHSPFTIEAWVRLDTLAQGLSSDDRKYLVLKKTEGEGDGFTSYGFLVQAGATGLAPNRFGKTEDVTGRELALAFGNPEATTDVMFFLISHLEITDDQWHYVAVAFDPEADQARFHLDDQVDVVEYEDPRPTAPAHFLNQAPLTLGAHRTAQGGGSTLDGYLDELRISRGVVPEEQLLNGTEPVLEVQPSSYVLDFGVVEQGAPQQDACIQVANTSDSYAHMITGEVDTTGVTDSRIQVQGGSFGPLPAGGAARCIEVTFDPSVVGEFSGEILEIHAHAYTYEFPAAGSPFTVELRGEVSPAGDDDDTTGDDDTPADDDDTPADDDDDGSGCGCSGQPSGGGLAPALLLFLFVAARRSRSSAAP